MENSRTELVPVMLVHDWSPSAFIVAMRVHDLSPGAFMNKQNASLEPHYVTFPPRKKAEIRGEKGVCAG